MVNDSTPGPALPPLPDANEIAKQSFEALCGRPHPWEGAQDWVLHAMRAYAMAEIAQFRKALIAHADNEYLLGVQQLRRDECLGLEAKVSSGKFGDAEYKAHQKASRHMGAHFGIYDAIRQADAVIAAAGSKT